MKRQKFINIQKVVLFKIFEYLSFSAVAIILLLIINIFLTIIEGEIITNIQLIRGVIIIIICLIIIVIKKFIYSKN